jgi:uncharacterized protein YdeI (YjbR/CyaY-like superfamily)
VEELYIKTRKEWRSWLERNHEGHPGIWLVFYKKHTGVPALEYAASVEEALCFGWIDSLVRRLDGERYVRKFTPRKLNSVWSDLNKKRVEKLIREKRMAEAGLEKVRHARKTGAWNRKTAGGEPPSTRPHPEFTRALEQEPAAGDFFASLAPSYRKRYVMWINVARQEKTRRKRIRETIKRLKQGKKPGLQ